MRWILYLMYYKYRSAFYVIQLCFLRVHPLLARSRHHINLAVMAAPPDAESLESRISECFKLILLRPCCPGTPTLRSYYP